MSTMSAAYGLDMTMPGDRTFNSGDSYFGGNLTTYVQNGTIAAERVDDMAARIMAGYFLLGQDKDYPAVSFYSWDALDSRVSHWFWCQYVAALMYSGFRTTTRTSGPIITRLCERWPLAAPFCSRTSTRRCQSKSRGV
jgi:hypothetical protein